MQTRRTFLKGLLASVAAGALVKNGVLQPEQVIAETRPWTIDMAANTWRRYTTLATVWNGYVAHCAVWKTWLTDEEMAAIGNVLSPWKPVWRRGIRDCGITKVQPIYGDVLDGYNDYLNVYARAPN
jgi:hypothetical protein